MSTEIVEFFYTKMSFIVHCNINGRGNIVYYIEDIERKGCKPKKNYF